MRPHKELPLFILWSSFINWLLDHTQKFPKHLRFTVTSRMDNYAIDVFEGIVEARYSENKGPILKRIDLSLEKLRLLIRISHERKYISHTSHEYAAKKIDEAGRMVGGWIKENNK